MITWGELKKYLRTKRIGHEFTKEDILYRNIKDKYVLVIDNKIDGYFNDLVEAGAIEKSGFDTYKILRRLTKKAKISVIRQMVKGDWKSWFMNDIFEE